MHKNFARNIDHKSRLKLKFGASNLTAAYLFVAMSAPLAAISFIRRTHVTEEEG